MLQSGRHLFRLALPVYCELIDRIIWEMCSWDCAGIGLMARMLGCWRRELQLAKSPVVSGLLLAGRSVTWVIYARDTLWGISHHWRRENADHVPPSSYIRASASCQPPEALTAADLQQNSWLFFPHGGSAIPSWIWLSSKYQAAWDAMRQHLDCALKPVLKGNPDITETCL
jgi:hypothetical protein